MSYTAMDDIDNPKPDVIHATGQKIRQLKGVPAVFRMAGMMVLGAKNGRITFKLPDAREVVFDHGNPGPAAYLEVHDYDFAKRALASGDIGFAESYMDGDWSTPDLTAVLEFFSENFEDAGQLAVGGAIMNFVNSIRHMFNRNTKAGSKRNIMAHYDLGNDFYSAWLDETMTYSSALYTDADMTLADAQTAKYARIADEIGLEPGKSVLEIGCGWGGFAEYAAKERGANVTCLTISPSQRDYAIARMARQGLSDKVKIKLEDYRDHIGQYDGVASIEMFEAVGETYWPSYFSQVAACLKSGAKAALQIITIRDDLFKDYRKRPDFIQRYIFPGGMLPSEKALQDQVKGAGLTFEDTHYFGPDYARTLREWAAAFEHEWPRIQTMGFDERFRRMWRFYLSYCEAGFDNGRINVGHFRLAKP